MTDYDIWLSTNPSDASESRWEAYVDEFGTDENHALFLEMADEYNWNKSADTETWLAHLAEYNYVPKWDDYSDPEYGRDYD